MSNVSAVAEAARIANEGMDLFRSALRQKARRRLEMEAKQNLIARWRPFSGVEAATIAAALQARKGLAQRVPDSAAIDPSDPTSVIVWTASDENLLEEAMWTSKYMEEMK